MMHDTPRNAILLATLLAFAGCLGAPAATVETPAPVEAEATPNVVRFFASDYAIRVPPVVEAGLADIRLESDGSEIHHAAIYRLSPGRTLDEFREAMIASRGVAPSWVTAYGGPNAAFPGAPTSALVKLDAGEYVVTCIIPSFDGHMHLEKGMMAAMTVIPSAGEAAKPPAPDVTVTLRDFQFDVGGTFAEGKQNVRVVNGGTNTHEFVLFELFGNATTMQLVEFIHSGGEPGATPPGRPLGGVTPLSPGHDATIVLDLAPGRYTVVCFDADGTEHGEPHLAIGMIHEFAIA